MSSPPTGTSCRSSTPSRIDRAAPTLGLDNHYVLETIPGYNPERIAELAGLGVIR